MTSFAFHFFGISPLRFSSDGCYLLRFEHPLEDADKRKVEDALLDDMDVVDWLNGETARLETAADVTPSLFETIAQILKELHAQVPLQTVVNHFARGRSNHNWEYWSLLNFNWPPRELLLGKEQSYYTQDNHPANRAYRERQRIREVEREREAKTRREDFERALVYNRDRGTEGQRIIRALLEHELIELDEDGDMDDVGAELDPFIEHLGELTADLLLEWLQDCDGVADVLADEDELESVLSDM